MYFHSTLQIQVLPVHTNREVVHLAHIDNNDSGSSLLFHLKSNCTQPRFALAQNMTEGCPRFVEGGLCIRGIEFHKLSHDGIDSMRALSNLQWILAAPLDLR